MNKKLTSLEIKPYFPEMKTTGLIIGLLMIASGIMNSRDVKPFGGKLQRGRQTPRSPTAQSRLMMNP
jgi:hypothetical protein